MRIFRQRYTYKGETRRSKKWYVEYTDAGGARVRVPGLVNKRDTEELGRRLEDDAARARAGLPPQLRRAAPVPLGDLILMFADHLGMHAGKDRVDLVTARLNLTLEVSGWNYPVEVTADRLSRTVGEVKTQEGAPLSAQTANHYLAHWAQFARWLARAGHLQAGLLAGVRRRNVEADRRRVRRAEGDVFLDTLLAVTRASPAVVQHLDGRARACLYLTAAATGLRARELTHLTADCFAIEADQPVVTVPARLTKNGKPAAIPLHPVAVPELRDWLPVVPAGEPCWPGCRGRKRRWGEMLRKDLAAAGLAYKTGENNYFDFHALRVQFVTLLARHSTPALTSNIYTKLTIDELAAEVRKISLPVDSRTAAENQVSTPPKYYRPSGTRGGQPGVARGPRSRPSTTAAPATAPAAGPTAGTTTPPPAAGTAPCPAG